MKEISKAHNVLSEFAVKMLSTGLMAGATYELLNAVVDNDIAVKAGTVVAILLSPVVMAFVKDAYRNSTLIQDTKNLILDKIDSIQETRDRLKIEKLLAPYIECAMQDGAYAIQKDNVWLVRETQQGQVVRMTENEFDQFKSKIAKGQILTTLEFTPHYSNDGKISQRLDGKLTRYQSGKIEGMTSINPGVIYAKGNKTELHFFKDNVDVTDIVTGKVNRLVDMLPPQKIYGAIASVVATRDDEASAVMIGGTDVIYLKPLNAPYFKVVSHKELELYRDYINNQDTPFNVVSVFPVTMGHDTIGVQRTVRGKLEGDTIGNPALVAYVSGKGDVLKYMSLGEATEPKTNITLKG
jgi:hypothetical protein